MEELPAELTTAIMGRLDGPSLAAAAAASAVLRRLSAEPHLWESLCLDSWPSLRHHRSLSCYRSFFRDVYCFPHPLSTAMPPPPEKLIWAVDLFHGGELFFSRLVEMDPEEAWFLISPLRVHVLNRNAVAPPPTAEAISPEKMELSCLVIDPAGNRAASLSSRRPVSVSRRRWGLGEAEARFATVISGEVVAMAAVVYEGGHLIEVNFTLEDVEGKCLSGRKSLQLLQAVLHGGRTGGASGEDRRRYEEFQERKKKREEEKMRDETRVNLLCWLLACVFVMPIVLARFLTMMEAAFGGLVDR